jgi:hypothetical protein
MIDSKVFCSTIPWLILTVVVAISARMHPSRFLRVPLLTIDEKPGFARRNGRLHALGVSERDTQG